MHINFEMTRLVGLIGDPFSIGTKLIVPVERPGAPFTYDPPPVSDTIGCEMSSVVFGQRASIIIWPSRKI